MPPASVLRLNGLRRSRRFALAAAAALAASLAPVAAKAANSALFQALPLEQYRFVLVAAPIGDGKKAQLNIYEQVRTTRPCFSVSGQDPAAVDPLLATFDFTGICSRYIDANGYSLRVGTNDLATSYRLSVMRTNDDTVLIALPTRAGAGPEMVVARTKGVGNGFLQLVFEPGWELKRRAFGGRALGHVYVYRESWPDAVATTSAPSDATAANPPSQAPAAVAAPPAAR
ncbi:DUF3747 domain-containing protein [Synechococcus sp. FGCU-3]|nr:DUF3747 domain-containing protein [Synechococcus sp. FGCU3]